MAEEERAPMTTTGEAARHLSWKEITELRAYEWLVTLRPTATYYEGLTVFSYPWGRREAFDHRRGALLLFRKGNVFPHAGQVWPTYGPSAETVATSLIGDFDAGLIVFVRRSLVVECPDTAEEALLDKRLWATFTRVNGRVTKLGDVGLMIDDSGNLKISARISGSVRTRPTPARPGSTAHWPISGERSGSMRSSWTRSSSPRQLEERSDEHDHGPALRPVRRVAGPSGPGVPTP